MSNRLVRGLVLGSLSLALLRCGDDTGKKVTDPGGDAGEAGQATASGGSSDVAAAATSGAPSNQAGADSDAGGAGGVDGSQGGMSGAATTAGAPSAGETGTAGAPSCEPVACCDGSEPLCEAGWDAICVGAGNYVTCCDPATGIARNCGYGGGGIDRGASVCLNDCTGRSFGTENCAGCVDAQDAGCDSAWDEDCSTKVYCSDPVAGYRLSCVNVDQYSTTVDVECLCNPDLAAEARR